MKHQTDVDWDSEHPDVLAIILDDDPTIIRIFRVAGILYKTKDMVTLTRITRTDKLCQLGYPESLTHIRPKKKA